MEFSRQEYWSGLPFPSPGDCSNIGIKPRSPALQANSLPSESPGKPKSIHDYLKNHSFDYTDLCWQSNSLLFNVLSNCFLNELWTYALVSSCSHFFSKGAWWSLFMSLWGILDSFLNCSSAGLGFNFPFCSVISRVSYFPAFEILLLWEVKHFLMLWDLHEISNKRKWRCVLVPFSIFTRKIHFLLFPFFDNFIF